MALTRSSTARVENVVPYCVSTADRNRNAASADIKA